MGLLRKRPSIATTVAGTEAGDNSSNPGVEKMNDSLVSKESLDFADAFGKKDLNDKAQEVMKSHLDLMLEVVMQIREDDDFAASIYDDCPRLQHLLDQHPDLRPVFEDPKLVRINFEKVYRDAGGVLPGDPPPKKQRIKACIAVIVNHPLFKILRFLLIIKKIIGCITGGGISLVRNCFRSTIGACCCDNAVDMLDGDIDADGEMEGSPENKASREALNKAADHMEQPEVQEKMTTLLAEEDPTALEEAIESDKELKALRDSNPLCAELMSDPDTIRILTEPENLRALGEAPDLIERDFVDPDWVSPDDLEAQGGFGGVMETVPEEGFEGDFDFDYGEEGDVDFDFDDDLDGDEENNYELEIEGDGDVDAEMAEDAEFDDDAEFEDDGELEDEEGGIAEDFEMGESEDNGNKSRGGNAKGQQKKQQNQKKEGGGAGGNFMSNLAAGLTDYVAGELVGTTMGELTGGGDLGGLEDVDTSAVEDIPVDDMADAAEQGGDSMVESATAAATTFESVEALTEGDALDNMDTLEEHMDTIEDKHDEHVDKEKDAKAATAGAAGAVAVGGATMVASRALGDDDDDEEEEDEPKKKNRFGFVGTGLSAISAAAKEHMATTLLGDDLGEMFMEEVEGDDEDDEDENGSQESKDSNQNSGRKGKK